MHRGLYSRRHTMKVAAGLGAAAVGLSSTAEGAAEPQVEGVEVKLAGYAYDRVRAIQEGRLPLDGCAVTFHVENIYNLNRQLFGPERPYEVSEIGLIPYLTKFANEAFRAYTLLPVFISRTFRHRNIFVRTDRGIEKPEDLRGKRVATPGYGMSSHTWIRGFLQDIYGVKPDELRWIETTESSDGGKWHSNYKKCFLPEDFPIKKGPPGVDESDLIVSGEVDALITAIEPRAYAEGHPKVRRLFPNVRAVEREYYKQTGVFPIMHAVAVRREFADEHPQRLLEICSMYSQAKQHAYEDLATAGVLKVTLPWANEELEETRALMGPNFWPYGVAANRKELELVTRYTHEQGLTKRRVRVDELFHPATLAWTEA
ncbi:MAG: ABC transporter substrate-binding protein [Planctomycetota bacterium]